MIQHQTNCLLLCGALLVSLVGGCGYSYKEVDADGDGYFLNGEEPDCWDAVEGPAGSGLGGADIHPGSADAWYDGVDANCDGVDDFDQDGDGVRCNDDRTGDEAGCTLDCNDQDAAVNPGVAEACTDGVDNDCDGLLDTDDVDDGDGTQDLFENTSFYLDVDSDGYGDENNAEVTVESCTAPAGYAVNGGDCDDDQAAIHPGAQERCDGVDQDCDGDARDPDSVNASTWYLDGDGDGYGVETDTTAACDLPDGYAEESGDCDDDAAEVNPGADEVCDDDDVDEDCDGEADDADPEGVTEGTEYHPDSDGDSFGRQGADGAVLRCDPLAGYVTDATDCNDGRADVNPDADEVCDDAGVDEDCDGLADSDDPSLEAATWYRDADSDGYGGDLELTACEAPGGYVASTGDCDDDEGSTYPGAPDTCGDEVVSDCLISEDAARESCQEAAIGVDDANRWLEAATKNAEAGASLAGAGDVDGDGLDDMLVGAPGYSSGFGRVWLIAGGSSGSDLDDTTAAARFSSDQTNDGLGDAVALGGDVDDDGYADLLMSAKGEDSGASDGGAAWLVLGPVSSKGLVDSARDTVLLGATSGLELGSALLITDLTNDEVADMVVGAAEYDSGSKTSAGAVYLLEGPPASGAVDPDDADVLLTGDKSGDRAASALAAPGDMDGDGVADLAIGVPQANETTGTDAGKVWMVWGPVDVSGALSSDIADYTLKGAAAADLAGAALAAAGDVTGDGYQDLWVGSPGATSGAGAVYLVKGDLLITGTLTLSGAVATLSGGAGGDSAGTAIAGLDIEGAGEPYVVVGAPGADDGTTSGTGAAFVVLGSPSGAVDLGDADIILYGSSVGDAAATALANVGDTDGDGLDDLLIGAPAYDHDAAKTDAGAVYLFTTWY